MNNDRKADFESLMISRSNELMAIKDRVYHLIKDTHWGEDGRYKEAILIKMLHSLLDRKYGVGTGFVICDDDMATSQIDIIIYNKDKNGSSANLLGEGYGDFVIVESRSVEAIIEVKSTFDSKIFKKETNDKNAIEKLLDNKARIGSHIFAGLFAFQTNYKDIHNSKALKKQLERQDFINCISFDKNYFLKFWNDTDDIPTKHPRHKHYSFYNFKKDLSFGYFISNLLEHLEKKSIGRNLNDKELKRLYVCQDEYGKETHLKSHLEINSRN